MKRVPPTVTRRHAVFGGDHPTVGADGNVEDRYRYRLERDLEPGLTDHDGAVTWIMLNPSIADARRDDQTIRRCMAYTQAWGYHRMIVVNLYALRATHPTELRRHEAPCGPGNDDAILEAVTDADLVVCAWGADPMAPARARAVTDLLLGDVPLWCLGTTKDGQPCHPCRLPVLVNREPFNDAARAAAETKALT